MVAIPTKNNLSPQDNPEAQLSDIADNQESCTSNSVAGGGDNEEPQHLSRAERLEKHKMQCQNLITYLTTNVCPPGLTKKEVRNIKNQAKTHQWDIKSKCTIQIQFSINILRASALSF